MNAAGSQAAPAAAGRDPATPRFSVVIAAHNEAPVIGRTLRTLLAGAEPGSLDITVVANGCTDQTARVAAAVPGVRVVELAAASKPAALNAGDRAAIGFPRVYLDADIQITAADLGRVVAALDSYAAAVPARRLELAGRPLAVRGYYAIHARLPVFATGLFGRGVIAVSEAGRARFGKFPDVVADDLFLDAQFADSEKRVVSEVSSVVATPRRTRDLVRRLARVRAGNAALRARAASAPATSGPAPRAAARLSWLRDVVLPRPWLAPAAVCYVAITLTAALLARRYRRAPAWGRDESTRTAAR